MKENSIEEDIKNAEHFIKSIKTDKEYKEENGWHGYYNKEIVELARILQHILSHYKRVFKEANRYKNMYKAEHEIHLVRNEQLDRKENAVTKCNELIIENAKLKEENEELKQDRNNNYQMIALAQNEVLGYMQGYEDGKKLKRSAVACVVENQQYYIIKKEIEHYKECIEKLQKENEYYKLLLDTNKNFTIDKKNGNYKWNVIEIQKVKDKIEKYKNMCISNVKGYENYFKDNYNELVFRRMEQLEKELLESEE